jgi:hypothetical protein
MSLKTTAKAAVHLLFFSLLSILFACGELSTSLFQSGGTYQVKVLINSNSLENCSIIRQGDKIIPYFAVSVEDDPDLTGLLVYLQNPKGDIVGERVLYTINPVNDNDIVQQKTQQEDKASINKDSEEEGESETAGQTEDGLPKQETEKQVSPDTKSAAKKYDTVIHIKSFANEMPSFPLPQKMEIGPYSLVFKALGISNTLSLTEVDIFYLGSVEFRLNGISTYLPWPSDTRLIPAGASVMLEANLDFDSSLDPYVIWYNGRNIIGEGNISEGAGNILWKAPEQSGLYSLRLEVLPRLLLQRNLTGFFREITLPISAKASQTGYFFENGLDNPAKRLLASGSVYAEQVQFATSRANADKPVLPESLELIRWYRFDGNLNEANTAPERMFEQAEKKVPRWAAVGQSYGLSVGPDDNYLLRPIRFFNSEQNQGGGVFLFHVRPASEGTIFNAFFPLFASASDGVWMDMAMRENSITLRLITKAASVEIPVNSGYSEEQGFISIAVEFFIRPNHFEARCGLGEDISMQSMAGVIRLPGALAGEGRIRLGMDKTMPDSAAETKSALESDPAGAKTTPIAGDILTETTQAVPTIWDEFAILSLTTPILSDDIETGNILPEQEPVKNENNEALSLISLP